MYYQLTCTCGRHHAVTSSQAGQAVPCQCGQSVAVPTFRALKELPPANPPETVVRPKAAVSTAARRPAIATGVLVAIFFVAFPTMIFLAYQRLTMDTSMTEESERTAAFAQLDQADPVTLSEAWYQYSSIALGLPSKPEFYFAERKRMQVERNLIIAAAIAAISGLGAGALAAGRRI